LCPNKQLYVPHGLRILRARSTLSVSSFERFKRFDRLRWLESVEVCPLSVLPSAGGTFDLHPARIAENSGRLTLGFRRRMNRHYNARATCVHGISRTVIA